VGHKRALVIQSYQICRLSIDMFAKHTNLNICTDI